MVDLVRQAVAGHPAARGAVSASPAVPAAGCLGDDACTQLMFGTLSRMNTSPKIPGAQPVFRRIDDREVPWQAVEAQRNADGSDSFVHEKWLAFSPKPAYLSLYARYDPGMVVRRHGHYSPHVVFVIAGDLSGAGRGTARLDQH